MSDSILLEEEIDDAYEPTEEEVRDYAQWIGMKLPEDEQFLYIAREGIKAPLPEPWKPCQTKEGEIYFFNFESGESVWEHPCDKYYKDQFLKEKEKAAKFSVKNSNKESKPKNSGNSGNNKPVSKSPVGLDKPTDPLLAITQLEKNLKEQKIYHKERFENELQNQIKDLQKQKELEIKHCKDQFERELKKKVELWQKELAEAEENEKKEIEKRIENKLREIKEENAKMVEDEKAKQNNKIQSELETFREDEKRRLAVEIDNAKIRMESEKKKLIKQIDEQKELQERYRKKLATLQEDLEEELKREERRLNEIAQEKLLELKKEHEYQISRAQLSARNRGNQESLQEKINDIKLEYEAKLSRDKKNLQSQHDEEIKKLREMADKEETGSLDEELFEIERIRVLDDLTKKYEILKREEMLAIDKEFSLKLDRDKERIESEYSDKRRKLQSNKVSVKDYSDLEVKIQKLQGELADTKSRLIYRDNEISSIQDEISHYKDSIDNVRSQIDRQDESLVANTKINELRRELNIKEQQVDKLKENSPERIERLERELRELKRIADPNSRFISDFEERPKIISTNPLLNPQNRGRVRDIELSDEDKLMDEWRADKDESWNLSRDISPVSRDPKRDDSFFKNPLRYDQPYNDQFSHNSWLNMGKRTSGAYMY